MSSRLARLLPAVALFATLLMSSQLSGDALASQASGTSAAPSISSSGRYVAFESTAANLVGGDTNAKKDVFLRDGEERTTERVSMGSGGAQGNGDSYGASISDDGRYVTFTSAASNLVSGDTNGAADAFVYDRSARTVDRVSVSEGGGQLSSGGNDPAISGDGRYIAFVTRSAAITGVQCPDLPEGVAPDTNGVEDIYAYDRSLKRTVQVVSSTSWDQCRETGQEIISTANGPSVNPSMSKDGAYVAFESTATYLVSGDTNGARDVFVRERSRTRPTRVSIADTGAQANATSSQPSLSDDGRYVAFQSVASNLDQNGDCCQGARDTDAASDIHVRDRSVGTTIWASRRPEAGATSVAASSTSGGGSYYPSISGDGRRVSFASDAALRTSGVNRDTNGLRDIYQTQLDFTDRQAVPLSFDDDQGLANGASDRPAESGDGRCTVFSSSASSFLPSFMADSNGVQDVYRHCFKPRLSDGCVVDRISESSEERADLAVFYGSGAEGVRPGRVDTCAGDPVNCATGNFFEEQVDFAIAGRGVGLGLSRTYNAQEAALASRPGPFGYGWSFSFGERLVIDAASGEVAVHHADGQVARFARRSDGSYGAERLVQSSLRREGDGSYVYTLPDQRTFAFDAGGRLSSKADPNANKTTLGYDGAGRLVSVTDPAGRKLTLAYNTDDTVSQVSDPGGRTVRYAYDTAKNLTQVTDVGAKVWQFAYDSKHRMTSMTNPRGAKTTNVYDSQDRVSAQTDRLGRQATWSYGADETKVTDPLGNVTYERFRSNLLVEIMGAHNTSAEAVTRLAYDAQANVVKTTDPNGRAWSYAYDAQGNATRATDPLGRSTAYAYDAKRNVTALTLPSGRVTSYAYDERSNLISIKRPHSETGQTQATALAYDGRGQLSSVTDPLDRTWRYGYNDQGDQTSATSPAGRETTSSYDQHSWLVASVSARGNAPGGDPGAYRTSYTRDAYGRTTAVRDPLGKTATTVYDAVGNVTDTTDRDARRTRVAYDLADRPTQVTRGDGSVLKSAYDALGQVTSQTDGLGRATTYAYTPLGWVSSTTDPLGRKTTYGYDPAGQRTSLRDPAGRTTTSGYDAAGRLTSMRYSSGTPKDSAFAYDVDGQLTAMTDATGRSTYSYDSLGRLTSSTNPHGQKLGYGYDLGDQITSLAYPHALTPLETRVSIGLDPVATGTVRRGYDQDGHLTSVADWLGNTTRFGYDPDGNLQRTERPNNTATTRTTDPNGLVTDLTDTAAAGTVLQAATPRSDAGLLASTSESGAAGAPAQRFSYDGAQRLSAAGPDATRNYAYDAADNPTTLPGGTTQTFDAANQLTRITSEGGFRETNLSYDSDGNRRSSNETVAMEPEIRPPDVLTSYGYDQADQLTGYEGPDRARPGQFASAQYAYDATGLCQSKTVDDVQTIQTWDRSGALPVLLTDGPTAYITGPDGKPIQQILQDGTVRYYHHDAHGSTRALTNQTANVVAKYTYDAHGNPTSPPTSAQNPFGYDSQYTDPESGLQYLRARYYDPTTAQFLTRDPITAQTRTPYTYANNSPTNYTDPTGMFPWEEIGGALIGDPQASGEALAGAANSATVGISGRALDAIGVNVNRCSTAYRAGEFAPIPSPGKGISLGAKVFRAVGGTGAGNAARVTGDRLLHAAQDPRLRNAIDELYRPGAKIGSGSSMDAYRFEQRTGTLLSRTGHGQKLLGRRTQLQRMLRSLEGDDRRIARDLLIDVQDALGGP